MFNHRQIILIDNTKPNQYQGDLLKLMVWLTVHYE